MEGLFVNKYNFMILTGDIPMYKIILFYIFTYYFTHLMVPKSSKYHK